MSSTEAKLAVINRALSRLRAKYPDTSGLSAEVVNEEDDGLGGVAITVVIKNGLGKQLLKLKVYDKRVIH